MKVNEFMSKNVISCHESATVEEAVALMAKNSISIVPIVDDSEKVVGVLTESDLISKEKKVPHAMVSMKELLGVTHHAGDIETIYKEVKKRPLREVMTKSPTTISPDLTLNSVVSLMEEKDLKRLPVVDNDKLVGVVTRKDLIRAFVSAK